MPSQNDVIASGNHATLAFSKMKSLREKSALCDISLKINSTEMRAHKVILAASSPYFEFMFTGNVTERTKECIEISGFCPDAFLTVLNFMYSGYLVVNEQTMLNVLKVADFLKISSAKEKCIQYLQDHIKISNCFEIRDIAKKYYFTELEAKIERFIENNFVELIKSEEFFQLSADEVSGLITEDRTYTDDSLYKEAISNWVDYEKSSREDMKDDLLGLLSAHIQNLAQKELIMHNSLLEKRIYVVSRGSSVKKVQFFDLKNKTWHIVCDKPELNCIEPIFHNQSIFLIGNDRFARYNMESEEWEIKKMPFSNDFTAACSVHHGIHLIIKGPSKGTFIYNSETNVLYTENQLIYKRCNPGVAFSENCIYVCGGGDESAERRDLRTKYWRSISSVPISSDGCSATSLNERIFLTSASSGQLYEFEKRKGIWIEKAKIPEAKNSSFALGSTDEAIYGYNGNTIFQYDTISDDWSPVANPKGWSDIVCVYHR